MKILLSITSSPWSRFKGGGQLAVHHLACALTRKGHEVHVLYSKSPGEHLTPATPYTIHWTHGFDVATINLDIFSFAVALNRLLRRGDFDVVHGNAEESFFSSCIAGRYRIPFVFTSHANIIPGTGIVLGMLRPIRFLKSVNNHLLRSAMARAQRIVTFSEFSSGLVGAALGKKMQQRIEVVPPGIDASWFEVVRNPQSEPHLLLWGRIEHQKGIDHLLQAMKIALDKVPDLRLTLVGEGNMTHSYRCQARDTGLLRRVTFAGWLSMREIQNLAAQATLGVFPSRIESFGLSMAEAMAAGLPVIATRVGALPEFIDDGVTGTLVPSGDIAALADAITGALENPQQSDRMAVAGRETVRQRFSWDAAADRTILLYQALKTQDNNFACL